MVNSKQKGARGEREFAAWLKERGINARRGLQYKGGNDSPDVITDLKNVHFEVKNTERLSLYDALKQAENDASENQIPVVVHKKNRKKWVMILDAEIAINLLK